MGVVLASALVGATNDITFFQKSSCNCVPERRKFLQVIVDRKLDFGKNDLVIEVIQTLDLDGYWVFFFSFFFSEFKYGLLNQGLQITEKC